MTFKAVFLDMIFAIPATSYSQEGPATLSEELYAPTSEARKRLQDSGFSFEASVTTDFISNIGSPRSVHTRNATNYEVAADIDTEKAGLWNSGSFHFNFLGDHGNNDPDITGQFQTASNIQAPNSFKLYEAFYEHQLTEQVSVLFGLHDYNSEFAVNDYGDVFLNAAFGIDTSISQSGPSIFPTSAVALRVKYQIDPSYYLQGAVYDGVPGDPDHSRGTHIHFSRSDGLFSALEAGTAEFESEGQRLSRKLALGAWVRTGDLEPEDESTDDSYGLYLVAEQSLFAEEDPSQGLGSFVQYGHAFGDINPIENYVGIGLNYVGLLPGRDSDSLGIGFNVAQFRDPNLVTDERAHRSEQIIELTYQYKILPYLAFQPDFQYVWNPLLSPTEKGVTVFIARIIVDV